LPFNTSAAVVGLIKAPALTMNAKRPLLYKGIKLVMAEFKPMLWPSCAPEKAWIMSFLRAMLGLALL
jgi:hypothetical protein